MIGKTINGYLLTDFQGKGSFGSVYKCVKNKQHYAMKIFNSDYVYQEYRFHGEHNRVSQEIIALGKVDHENVIKYIDHGSFIENHQVFYYVILEYIDGSTLEQVIQSGETINNEVATLEIISQVLLGLKAIHDCNIVHRDLKPENIYLTTSGTVKVLDFGLAKLIDYSSITETGDRLGSPLYMAPEQIRDSKRVDERTDLYAVGVILFQMLTGTHPYGSISSREELYYKIINEPPLAPSLFIQAITNNLENTIMTLLNKQNYERYNNAAEVYHALIRTPSKEMTSQLTEFPPTFMLRVYNEKTVLEQYLGDGNTIELIEFPANLREYQLNLHKLIRENSIDLIIDPATMRLAYDSFKEVKGLVNLPYAPAGYDRLEISDLDSIKKKKDYVQSVLNLENELGATKLVTPFHFAQNSNFVGIRNPYKEDWFAVDVKLIKESWDYVAGRQTLIAGIAVDAQALSSREEREYFLNVLTGLKCDGYLIYVDCIDESTNQAQLFNYIKTLKLLQDKSNRPVIAGRLNSIGLGLLSLGIYAFSSGAARFDSFYEDLMKDREKSYNMYIRYYVPELLVNLPVLRKDPQKLFNIMNSKVGQELKCGCPYCTGIEPDEITDKLAQLHFLYRRTQEVKLLKSLPIKDRLSWFLDRLSKAEGYYKSMTGIFKSDDYKFIKTWKQVFLDLKKEFNIHD